MEALTEASEALENKVTRKQGLLVRPTAVLPKPAQRRLPLRKKPPTLIGR